MRVPKTRRNVLYSTPAIYYSFYYFKREEGRQREQELLGKGKNEKREKERKGKSKK